MKDPLQENAYLKTFLFLAMDQPNVHSRILKPFYKVYCQHRKGGFGMQCINVRRYIYLSILIRMF